MPQNLLDSNLLKQLLDNTPDIVFFKDKNSRYVEFNDAMLKLLGADRAALIGKDTRTFLPEDLTEEILREDREIIESRMPVRKENWVEFSDGTIALMDTIIAPIFDENGEVIGLLGIGRDITELKNATTALKEQNISLEKANRELDNLIYHAAHDLRAPLTSVLGLLNLMRDEQDPVVISRYIDLQEEKIQRLDSFIQDIVNLSKNSREHVEVGKIDLEEMYFNIVAQFRFLPGAARIQFRFQQSGEIEFHSDGFRLSLVLSNLLSNAVRYHDPQRDQPSVMLIATISPLEALIQLCDNGQGIPTENLGRIFEMFYRAHKTSKGSGIGLYITKETVQKLGGEISARSTEGVGTTFEIRIPNHFPDNRNSNPTNDAHDHP